MRQTIVSDIISTKSDDFTIVRRILAGEKELFEILLRRHNQTLYRAVRSYITDELQIEDVMQNTYLKAYANLHQFRGDSAWSTWLIRIGINESLQFIRKNKRQKIISLNTIVNERELIHNRFEQNQMNPEKEMITQETRHVLEKSIDRLPEKYKVVYILKEVEGMDNSDIAKCLDLSETNIKVRLHRARNLLKDALYRYTKDKELFEFGNSRCNRLVNNVMKYILS